MLKRLAIHRHAGEGAVTRTRTRTVYERGQVDCHYQCSGNSVNHSHGTLRSTFKVVFTNMSVRSRPGYYRQEVNKTIWEVPERYKDLKQVGTGAYGTVW